MNRTLNQSEMSSLVAYYQIRGGDGNTLFDLSCNGRNLVANSGFYNYNIFDHANVQDKRPIVKETKSIVPNHALVTEYKYNSLGQVFWQKTPDADVSEFFYDRLGRLVISQNAEQKLPMVVDANNPANRFSYTKYDQLGRITEVGERLSSTAGVSADNTRNDSWLSSWMFSGTVRQSTRTLYDFGNSIGINSELANNNVLVNGRNRVVAVLYIPTGTNPNGRSSATYYSYDLMGNVKDLYQENIAFGAKQATLISNGSRLKRINYEYDLISGKVNYVHYQPGKWDQFHYYYNYDAENRLTEAWTSRVPGQRPSDLGDIHWTRDAQYSYYLHGPLSQMLLGKNLVQGLDYAYTLQGWLKGVNGQYLDPTRDMGKHGTGPLATIPRDNLAFSLGYNQLDYSPIGQSSANAFTLQYNGAHTGSGAGVDLYNGNIRNTTYAIRGIRAGEPTAYAYRYDQLNRLKLHLSFGLTSNTTTWNLSSTNLNYDEQFVYDPNGNITQAKRKGGATGWIDDLTYHYNIDLSTGDLTDNRLNYVSDVANNPAGGGDIRNQSFGNYVYDRIGNLIIDNQPEANERITKIEWTVYGKIQSVQKHNGDLIVYSYDPSGNRIQKSVTSGGVTLVTYYVRDAQGNVMAVYESTNTSLTWKEQYLYGSSRLGVALPNIVINSTQVLSNDSYAALGTDGFNNGVEGKRRYELSNHLGNVLVTITDRKFWNGVQYESELITSQQYYAFGMLMPGMQFGASGNYRYGFNGQEMSNEIKGTGNSYTAEFWEYDPRVGTRWNTDPVVRPNISPYVTLGSNPIMFVDRNGDDWFVNHLGFYIWSDDASVMTQGFTQYVGTSLPSNVPKYNILTYIETETNFGKQNILYHKYHHSGLKKFLNWLGSKSITNKEYSTHDELMADEYVGMAIGFAFFRTAGIAFNAFKVAGGSLWRLSSWTQRGFVYEVSRGANLVRNFPVIDKFLKGVATSIKTLDLQAPTYAKEGSRAVYNTLKGYIDKLKDFKGANKSGKEVLESDIKEKVLDVAIPKGATKAQVEQIQEAIKYGQNQGIKVEINVVK